MRKRQRYILVRLLVGCVGVSVASAGGIPEPSPTIYGSITVDGVAVAATDSVQIIATIDGVQQPVGEYVMGDNAGAAGQCAGGADCYVLQLRLETPVPDHPRSDNAAVIGDTVRIFVQTAMELIEATTHTIATRGELVPLDLEVFTLPDTDGDGDSDLLDVAMLQRCFTGANNGPIAAGCESANRDDDNDVDLDDFALFATRSTGPS